MEDREFRELCVRLGAELGRRIGLMLSDGSSEDVKEDKLPSLMTGADIRRWLESMQEGVGQDLFREWRRDGYFPAHSEGREGTKEMRWSRDVVLLWHNADKPRFALWKQLGKPVDRNGIPCRDPGASYGISNERRE